MKTLKIIKIALPAVVLALASCRTASTLQQKGGTTAKTETTDKMEIVSKVAAVNHADTRYVSSKIKMNLGIGGQDISLSGNLRMKRDDVIRLQLVALGLIEAGRIEFTPDYVLVMDRINKQYIKVAYKDVAFLRESGLNFHSLQSLFWDELFKPGTTSMNTQALNDFNAYAAGTDVAVMLERGPLTYRWMADKNNGLIKTANVTYKDATHGNTQLNWRYAGFEPMGAHKFPTQNDVTVTTTKHTVKMNYTLNGIGNDSDWETRTVVPAKYKQVKLDDILRKLSSL